MRKRPMYYRRDGTPYSGTMEWAEDFEKSDRRVAKDVLADGKVVSTVFLGLDHNWGGGKPLIFETMVFSEIGGEEVDIERYSTEEEAVEGHKKMVKKWKREVSIK